jgi:hypothetical protein
VGSRTGQAFVLSERTYALTLLGRWDEALATFGELSPDLLATANILSPATGVLEIYLRRGDLDAAEALIQRYDGLGDSVDMQAKGCYYAAVSATAAARGAHRDALAAAQVVIDGASVMGLGAQDVKQAMRHALESAFALGEQDTVERLLAIIDEAAPGLKPPFLAALANRVRALLAGELPAADRRFAAAVAQFRALELPFDEAVASLEYAEWLGRIGRPGEAEPLLSTAREIFDRLGATPWLERATAAESVTA